MARESSSSVSIPEFHRMLVLARWALGIFNEASFENISAMLKAPNLEGLNSRQRVESLFSFVGPVDMLA